MKLCRKYKMCIFSGWDHTQTIDSLLRKGGFRAQITADVRRAIKLTRYQSHAIQMSYNEFRDRQSQCHKIRR